MKSLDSIIVNKKSVHIGLFALLIFIIFVIPVFNSQSHPYLYSSSFTLLFIGSIFTLRNKRQNALKSGVLILIAFWITVIFDLKILNVLADIVISIFFIVLVVRFLSQVARSERVNSSVIFESISGYFMVGLVLSYFMVLAIFFFPDSLIFPNTTEPRLADVTYFTFVTMSTLGYGDVLPNIAITRSLSIFISVTGQIYLAVIIAMLVGKYSSQGKA
jgi:hypothetical protein